MVDRFIELGALLQSACAWLRGWVCMHECVCVCVCVCVYVCVCTCGEMKDTEKINPI